MSQAALIVLIHGALMDRRSMLALTLWWPWRFSSYSTNPAAERHRCCWGTRPLLFVLIPLPNMPLQREWPKIQLVNGWRGIVF
jgi:hypothetical protein